MPDLGSRLADRRRSVLFPWIPLAARASSFERPLSGLAPVPRRSHSSAKPRRHSGWLAGQLGCHADPDPANQLDYIIGPVGHNQLISAVYDFIRPRRLSSAKRTGGSLEPTRFSQRLTTFSWQPVRADAFGAGALAGLSVNKTADRSAQWLVDPDTLGFELRRRAPHSETLN